MRAARLAATAIALLALLGSGCASIPWPFSRADGLQRGYTQEDLGGELAAYSARFGAVVSDTVKTLLTQVGYWEKYHKAKKGEDVSAMVLRTTIKERTKKTRRMKKATVTDAAATA